MNIFDELNDNPLFREISEMGPREQEAHPSPTPVICEVSPEPLSEQASRFGCPECRLFDSDYGEWCLGFSNHIPPIRFVEQCPLN